jgi:hypothetical protein
MAAAPDDDARRTLAELEAKLRELERELLRGHEPAPHEPEPGAHEPPPAHAFDTEPGPATPPEPLLDAQPEPATPPEPLLDAQPEPATPPEPLLDAQPTPPEPDLHAAPEPPAPPVDAGDWVVPGVPTAAAPPEPEPEPEPEPPIDFDALRDAHDLLGSLRATIEELGFTAERVTAEARAVIDDHGRTLGRLERAGEAAARAEQAAIHAGRLAATVVVEAGPFADAAAVGALRDVLAAQPGARDAYVRGVEDGRAVIEVHLAPPPP